MNQTGKVILIGAGPGDCQLLTLKAAESIGQADVIVYDRLLGEGVLKLARPEAKRIYVGKGPDCHTASQSEINRILVEEASLGNLVARVKGGDPFLFGRGGEEAEALVEHQIPFEVVPGVTSAIAVPAYAGIPVTHRDFCSSLHIITGHEQPGRNASHLDYALLAQLSGTLVFLMGVHNLSTIAASLIANGKSSATPVAVIERGTTREQRVITGTLERIADLAQSSGIASPAVIVVGDVVNLREKLAWFPKVGPLSGKKIVVTRAREQASSLVQKIEVLGGTAIELPVIQIAPPESTALEQLDRTLARINDFTWLVFTSVNGVKAFWSRWQSLQMDIRSLAGIKLAAVGPATRDVLADLGLRVDYLPESYTTERLTVGLLERVTAQDRILCLRADIASAEMPSSFEKAGIACESVVAYRTLGDPQTRDLIQNELQAGKIDYLTFTSSSTVQNFLAMLSQEAIKSIQVKTICIGPVTAATALQAGLEVTAVAKMHTIDGLIDTILELEAEL